MAMRMVLSFDNRRGLLHKRCEGVIIVALPLTRACLILSGSCRYILIFCFRLSSRRTLRGELHAMHQLNKSP